MSTYFSMYGPAYHFKMLEFAGMNAKVKSLDYTIPDCLQTGPFMAFTQGSDNFGDGLKVQHLKQLNSKFPLVQLYHGALPLLNQRKSKSALNCLGNSLSYYEINDSKFLLSLENSSKGKSKVVRCELEFGHNKLVSIQNKNKIISIQDVDKLSSVVVGNKPLGMFQTKENLFFTNLESREQLWQRTYEVSIIDSSLHPRLEGYFATCNENGEVQVHVSEKDVPIWSYSKSTDLCSSTGMKCKFGNHPSSIIIKSSLELFETDFRTDRSILNIHSVPQNPNKFVRNDFICSFNPVEKTPYIFVNTSQSTYLYDDRYCKAPIHITHHMLEDGPTLSALSSKGSLNLLTLAGSNTQTLSIIANNFNHLSGHSESLVEALSTPGHFSILSDTVKFATKTNNWCSYNVTKNITSQWVGLSAMQSSPNDSHCVFVQNVYGDIFCQQFAPNSIPISKEVETEILETLNKFEAGCLIPNDLSLNKTSQVTQKEKQGDKTPSDCLHPLKLGKWPNNNNNIQKKDGIMIHVRVTDDQYSFWHLADLVKKNKKFPQKSGQNEIMYLRKYKNNYKFKDGALSDIVNGGNVLSVLPKEMSTGITIESLDAYEDPLAKQIFPLWKEDSKICFERSPHSFFKNHSLSNFENYLEEEIDCDGDDVKHGNILDSLQETFIPVNLPEKIGNSLSLNRTVLKSTKVQCRPKESNDLNQTSLKSTKVQCRPNESYDLNQTSLKSTKVQCRPKESNNLNQTSHKSTKVQCRPNESNDLNQTSLKSTKVQCRPKESNDLNSTSHNCRKVPDLSSDSNKLSNKKKNPAKIKIYKDLYRVKKEFTENNKISLNKSFNIPLPNSPTSPSKFAANKNSLNKSFNIPLPNSPTSPSKFATKKNSLNKSFNIPLPNSPTSPSSKKFAVNIPLPNSPTSPSEKKFAASKNLLNKSFNIPLPVTNSPTSSSAKKCAATKKRKRSAGF